MSVNGVIYSPTDSHRDNMSRDDSFITTRKAPSPDGIHIVNHWPGELDVCAYPGGAVCFIKSRTSIIHNPYGPAIIYYELPLSKTPLGLSRYVIDGDEMSKERWEIWVGIQAPLVKGSKSAGLNTDI